MRRGVLHMRAAISAALLLLGMSLAAPAQRLASALSSNTVSVDSSFSGETVTIFGNIEPEIGSDAAVPGNDYQIVVLVQGPSLDRVARRKTGDLGLWLNTEQVLFEALPSFFWVIASSPLADIADAKVLDEQGLLPTSQPERVASRGNGDPALMASQLVRLMEEAGLYGVRDHGVNFRSRTLYSAGLSLPANVLNGNFLAKTFLFRNGELIAKNVQSFSVQKTGFERLVGTSAKTMPLLYGLICVVLAVFTGWLGGVVFRR